MTTPRIGDWLQSHSGKQLWPLDPRAEDFDIDDTAYSLAHLNRYVGHFGQYSVAEHSVRGSYVIAPSLAPAFMFHDAAETLTNDIGRPFKRFLYVKKHLQMIPLKEMETQILSVIFGAFEISWPTDAEWKEIEFIDRRMLSTEVRDLVTNRHPMWKTGWLDGYPPLAEAIVPWPAEVARVRFLERWEELRGNGA